MNLRAKYYRWRYDRLWNLARRLQAQAARAEDPWKYKPREEYLNERQQKKLEDFGYKWWKEFQKPTGFTDVTEKARLDANFSPKFEQAEFLKRQAVENHEVDSFWYPEAEGIDKIAEDTHTDISFAYCQAGHLHEYHNDQLMQKTYNQRISKHLTVREAVFATVPKWLFGVKDKTIREVEGCG